MGGAGKTFENVGSILAVLLNPLDHLIYDIIQLHVLHFELHKFATRYSIALLDYYSYQILWQQCMRLSHLSTCPMGSL